MSIPRRIQRKRVKGWRLPPNTVCISRPGKFGNPFRVREEDGVWFVEHWQRTASGTYIFAPLEKGSFAKFASRDEAVAYAIERFRKALELRLLRVTPEQVRAELRGKDLACWCREEEPCHGDVLLQVANS